MKLRIKGNSIRLRLGQSELLRLVTDGTLEESASFGPSADQRFSYALSTHPDEPAVSAGFDGWRLDVRVPLDVVHQWATTDQVGIHALQPAGDDGELRILIEKDFECIEAPADESQEDAFPHPEFGAACVPTTTPCNNDFHDEHRNDQLCHLPDGARI